MSSRLKTKVFMAGYKLWEGHRPIEFDVDNKMIKLWPYFCSGGRIKKCHFEEVHNLRFEKNGKSWHCNESFEFDVT